MKRDFLKGLELTDEVIEKIMAEYGKSAEQTKNELAAANTQIKSLQDAVKTFDGVDVEALKKTAADWEEKYNKDIAALKLSSAVDNQFSHRKTPSLQFMRQKGSTVKRKRIARRRCKVFRKPPC